MRLFKIVWMIVAITGSAFAQNNLTPGSTHIHDHIFESKNLSGRNLQLHPEYDVLSYDIHTTIFPDSEKIEARTSISIVIKIDMETELIFDFAGLQIDSVFLDSAQVQNTLQGELLILDLETPLMMGDTHLVRVHYQGTPERGLYFRSNSDGAPVIYTHNEPFDAHYWFPCKDDPSDKAKLQMTVEVPDQFVVLSNGELIEKTESVPQHTIYIWQEDYPIATYLISIATSPYLITTDIFTLDGNDLLLEYFVYPEDLSRGATALEWTIEMLDFYSHYIGDYPFFLDKYSMSEVPFKEASAMENQTATTMGDFVMDNEEVIAHELAHQWWGDALTPQSFVDIWLNEGFATYFDALFTEYKYGDDAFLQRMETFKSLMTGDGSFAYPIYNPPEEYLFGRAVYFKGAWILHMLRYEVGNQKFQDIIQQYYDAYNYLNVITGSFVEIVESVSGESYSTFFNQWLNYGGMPVLIGTWEQDKSEVQLLIIQDQPEPVYQFDLEVLVEGISADTLVVVPIYDRETTEIIKFSEPVLKIIIDPNNKILSTTNSPLYYIPVQSSLLWLYPNPFSESISISYQIEKAEEVKIVVYDVLGQIVEILLDEKMTTGIHQVEWDGKKHASGSYYCVMTTSDASDVRKMTLVK